MVPYPAGGPVDVTARLIAQSVGNSLGQPIAVDNRGGGAGVIGSVAVQHAEPDGHTLILGTNQTHATNQSLLKNCPYDAVKDFAPVAGIAEIPHVLVVRHGLEARRRRRAGAAREEIARRTELCLDRRRLGLASCRRVVQDPGRRRAAAHPVPRLGADDHRTARRPRRSDLRDLAERDQSYIDAGVLRALAVASAKRAPRLPNLPTLAEAGVPGVEADAWFALFAPAKTPAATIEKLYRAVSAGADHGASRSEAIAKQGMTLALRSPSGTGRLAAGRSRQMGGGDQGGGRRRGIKATGARLNRSGIVL